VLGLRSRWPLAATDRAPHRRTDHRPLTRNTRLLLVRGASRVHFPPLLQQAPKVSPSRPSLTTPKDADACHRAVATICRWPVEIAR
jgi:hypothetical protein